MQYRRSLKTQLDQVFQNVRGEGSPRKGSSFPGPDKRDSRPVEVFRPEPHSVKRTNRERGLYTLVPLKHLVPCRIIEWKAHDERAAKDRPTKEGSAKPQKTDQSSRARDQAIRAALDQHWAASDANDFETEHRIYLVDAVLDYPQSGERTRGRSNIQNQRASQPNKKRFTVRRIIGSGDLWVTELILTYDGKPSCTVSIMEFRGDKVARETQYFRGSIPGASMALSMGRTDGHVISRPKPTEG